MVFGAEQQTSQSPDLEVQGQIRKMRQSSVQKSGGQESNSQTVVQYFSKQREYGKGQELLKEKKIISINLDYAANQKSKYTVKYSRSPDVGDRLKKAKAAELMTASLEQPNNVEVKRQKLKTFLKGDRKVVKKKDNLASFKEENKHFKRLSKKAINEKPRVNRNSKDYMSWRVEGKRFQVKREATKEPNEKPKRLELSPSKPKITRIGQNPIDYFNTISHRNEAEPQRKTIETQAKRRPYRGSIKESTYYSPKIGRSPDFAHKLPQKAENKPRGSRNDSLAQTRQTEHKNSKKRGKDFVYAGQGPQKPSTDHSSNLLSHSRLRSFSPMVVAPTAVNTIKTITEKAKKVRGKVTLESALGQPAVQIGTVEQETVPDF